MKFTGLTMAFAVAFATCQASASLSQQETAQQVTLKPKLPVVACLRGQTLIPGYWGSTYGCRGRFGCGIIDVYYVEAHCGVEF